MYALQDTWNLYAHQLLSLWFPSSHLLISPLLLSFFHYPRK
jgi:hypothetical protein